MKNLFFFAFMMGMIFVLFSCRKKLVGIEIEFFGGVGNYCGSDVYMNECPREIQVMSNGNRYVSKFEIPKEITDKPLWWNKKYIATLKVYKEKCSCLDTFGDIITGEYPTKEISMVEIVEIHLKE